MARKKAGSKEECLVVQKSRPLFSLWRSDLTLAEFKILDIYLSRINSHDPDKRSVVFEKGEMEKCLGVSQISIFHLKQRLYHLMGNVVEISEGDDNKSFNAVTLFEEATAKQDDYGSWQVKLECTQKAMKYFFNVDNLGYLRYKLHCITSITSRYTYILFIYLESNRFRKSWEVDLEELKHLMNCSEEETYKEYKYFNNLLLKKAQKELHDKTDCNFEYKPVKRGRKVVAIKFELQPINPLLETETELELSVALTDQPEQVRKHIEMWEESIAEFNFSKEQIEEIRVILQNTPDEALPCDTMTLTNNDLNIRRCSYIKEIVASLKRYDKQNRISNKYLYMLRILKANARKSE